MVVGAGPRLLAVASALRQVSGELLGDRAELIELSNLLAGVSDGSDHQDPVAVQARTQTGIRSARENSERVARLADQLTQFAHRLMRP